MAARYATRRYSDIVAFLRDWEETLRAGGLLLPAGTVDGEPAPDMKIDVVLPDGKRIGPIGAQVVNRLRDGGVAVHIAEVPPDVRAAATEARGLVNLVRDWLLETGAVARAGGLGTEEIAGLRKRVADLERLLAGSEAGRADLTRTLAAGGGAPVPVVAAGRGFPVPDTAGMAPLASGRMGDNAFRDALMAWAVEKTTGMLTIRYADGRERWGFWSKGGVVGWRTEPVDEQEVLGILLFRANQITREQLGQSVDLMKERDCRQGEALIEMGVLTFAQLVLLLQKQAEFVFQRVLADTEGAWTFHRLTEFPERFVAPPVRVAAILFRQLRQRAKDMPQDELAEALRGFLDRYLFVKAGVEKTFDEMRLSTEEQGFIKIVTATSYRLREIPAVSNLSRSSTAGIVWCLNELGLIEFRAQEATARASERVGRSLQSRKVVLDRGTLFDRLDLHWICTAAEVEAAWKRLDVEFPASDPARYGEEWRNVVVALRKGMEEAYQKLKVDSARREYRATVIERTMVEQSALMLAGKGDMAAVKDQPRESWECYSKAIELNPSKPEFQAGLARASAAGGRPK